MASTQLLKRRVRSVKNTRQITKAMELVAASKLRRVQAKAESSKAYAQVALRILSSIASQSEAQTHQLFMPRPQNGKLLYVIFGSDRGLAGALNSNVIGALGRELESHNTNTVDVIAVGRKMSAYLARLKNVNLLASYEALGDEPDPSVFGPLVASILKPQDEDYQAVYIVYTRFVSTLTQQAISEQLLPIQQPKTESEPQKNLSFEFEPSIVEVLSKVGKLFIDSRIAQAYLESTTSEHAMRMVAMNNATKSAGDLIDSLTLELNSLRQATVTQEIAEITSGAEALK